MVLSVGFCVVHVHLPFPSAMISVCLPGEGTEELFLWTMFLSSYRPGVPEAMTIEQLWLTAVVKFILQFHSKWLHMRKKKCVPKICAEATATFVVANRKQFSSFVAPCSVCSGATWLPHELSRKTHRWVIETLSYSSLITSQTKSYSLKSSSLQSLWQVSLWSCAFFGAPPESAFKHEHIFNQARKSVKYKVHHRWSCRELPRPRGEGARLDSLFQLPPVLLPVRLAAFPKWLRRANFKEIMLTYWHAGS